jgi:hypothetical protein
MKKTVQALPLDWFSMKCSAFLRKKKERDCSRSFYPISKFSFN